MGGGGPMDWKKPDYTKYKVEEIPQLLRVQKELANEGLHDPWLRNHAWKFMGGHKRTGLSYYVKHTGFVRGALFGVAFVALWIAGDQAYGLATGRKKDDGHH